MNAEANSLVEEYNRIVESTKFNGTSLFASDPHGVRIQAGVGTQGSLLLDLGSALSRNVGDGTFTAGQSFAVGDTTMSLAMSDFNQDGHADIVTANMANDSLSVAFGNGDGTFNAPLALALAAGAAPVAVVTGDVNGDGLNDIVTGGYGYAMNVILSNGNGTFQAARTCGSGQWIYSLVAGDLNGDGRLDIAAAGYAGTVDIFLGNGDGTLQAPRSFPLVADIKALAISDFNGDGVYDLLAAGYMSRTAHVLMGNGDGTFQTGAVLDSFYNFANAAGTADFNGDGREDVAVNAMGISCVFLGNGDGTFQARSTASANGSSLAVGDFNGDGREDLATTGGVLLGKGDGTFQTNQSLTTNFNSTDVVVGDVNGDGRTDIVASGYELGPGQVNVMLAQGSKTAASQLLNINSRQGALNAMTVLSENLGRIESELGAIGAAESRFTAALATLQAVRENELAASSRIMDADIAQESAQLLRLQILQQAGAAVLVQANQQPKLALELLAN